ncbi:unnamed protein product [Adineta steineri]|uniref:Conserved oligomeric Golgi complex subunit 5 n=1 Tax=Adineta steineri TaxID=433720 RepID=A0A818KAK3_9BILA|nr:unnamed protein product [Adineta steineri]CAF1405767.1 unnamed protein product [Adineta steineri]CAF3553174.1 unnamed protein product [Adineta steineri]CAF3621127.1 unnamed protein product [Adineta steineri]
MECTILNDESFKDFIEDDFDIKSFSANILQTQIVTDYLQHLNELIRTLDAEIKQQVSSNAPILFRQASSIGTIEDVLENMQTRIKSLKATADRISSKVTEPYNKILSRKNQLTRLQNTCDLLRRIKGILQQTKKLEKFMAPSNTGQQQIELVKASQCLNELEHFTVDADFTGIDAVEKDLQFVFKARHDIQTQAQDVLENGLHHLNPAQIGTALQVFFNLGTLHDHVQSIEQRLLKNFQTQIADCLDLKQLSKNKDPSNPGRSTMPSVGNTPQFRASLWINIEKILDLLYVNVAQLYNLSRVLTKKKDPITHGTFMDELIKHDHSGELVSKFWMGAMKVLRKQLRVSVSDSLHLKQALEGEYPKLLKLQNDLINRLNQLQPGFSDIEMDTIIDEKSNDSEQLDEKQKTSVQLNECFDIFEQSYLSISLSRLSDPINLMFSSSTMKLLPTQQELENLIKVIVNELSVTTVSEALVNKVARNIAKAIQLFAAKCEQSICTDSEGSQVVSAPTPAQLRNISAINILYNFCSMITKMLGEQQNLSLIATTRITDALQCVHSLMNTAIHPFLNSVADCIEAILVTMHNEDFSQIASSRTDSQSSLYMKELQEFIFRIHKDYFSEFQCKDFMYENLAPIACRAITLFIEHISLVRPIAEGGLLRLVVDFAQIELALSPFCRRLTDLGKHYKILKAFRSLLILTTDEIQNNSAVGDIVPYDIVLQHLFSRAPSEMRSPHQAMNWSISRYIQWLDEHPKMSDRLAMIKGTLDTYVQIVRNRQQKEFAPIYVIILNILEKGLAATA